MVRDGTVWIAALMCAGCVEGTSTLGLEVPGGSGGARVDAGSLDVGSGDGADPAGPGGGESRCTPGYIARSEVPYGTYALSPGKLAFWGETLVLGGMVRAQFTSQGRSFASGVVHVFAPSPLVPVPTPMARTNQPAETVEGIAAWGSDLLVMGRGPTTLAPEAVGGFAARVHAGERDARTSTWVGAPAAGRLHGVVTASTGAFMLFGGARSPRELSISLVAPGEALGGSTNYRMPLDRPVRRAAAVFAGGRSVQVVVLDEGLSFYDADVGRDASTPRGHHPGFEDATDVELHALRTRLVAVVRRPDAIELLAVSPQDPTRVLSRVRRPLAAERAFAVTAREDRLAFAAYDLAEERPEVWFFDENLAPVHQVPLLLEGVPQFGLRDVPLGMDMTTSADDWALSVSYAKDGDPAQAHHVVWRFDDCTR